MQNAPSEIAHQSVTELIKFKTPTESIRIGFTEQKVSGHAGLSTFTSFLVWQRVENCWGNSCRIDPPAPNAMRTGGGEAGGEFVAATWQQ